MRILIGALLLTALLLALAPGAARSQQQRPEIAIQDFEFKPAELRVTLTGGKAEVRWVSNGPSPHHVVADRGTFDSKPLARGASFSFTFTGAGTFAYHCQIHPSMKGQVIVANEQKEPGEGY